MLRRAETGDEGGRSDRPPLAHRTTAAPKATVKDIKKTNVMLITVTSRVLELQLASETHAPMS